MTEGVEWPFHTAVRGRPMQGRMTKQHRTWFGAATLLGAVGFEELLAPPCVAVSPSAEPASGSR